MTKSKPEFVSLALALALTLGHFLFLFRHYSPAISTPDAQGYFTQARLLATQGTTRLTVENPVQYVGPHWHTQDGRHYFTTFPPGLPALLAIAMKIGGVSLAFLLNPVLASATLLVFFALVRDWLPAPWALLAALLLAANPTFNEHALFGDAHTAVVFLFLLSLLLVRRAVRKKATLPLVFAGLALGLVPCVRYAEAVLWVAGLLYGAALFHSAGLRRRFVVPFGIAALAPVLLLTGHNWWAFGAPWNTGYGLAISQPAFSLDYLLDHVGPMAIMLLTAGVGPLLFFSIAGFPLLLAKPTLRRDGLFFLASTVLPFVLYAAYLWPVDLQSMRFLLPTFPFYVLVAVLFLASLRGRIRATLVVLVVLALAPPSVLTSLRAVNSLHLRNKAVAEIADFVKQHVPEGTVLVTLEAVCQDLDTYGRWKLVHALWLRGPSVFVPEETDPRFRNRQGAALYRDVLPQSWMERLYHDLSHWSGGEPIFVLTYAGELDELRSDLRRYFRVVRLSDSRTPALETGQPLPPPPRQPGRGTLGPPGGKPPSGTKAWLPNQVFDLALTGETLVLVKLVPLRRPVQTDGGATPGEGNFRETKVVQQGKRKELVSQGKQGGWTGTTGHKSLESNTARANPAVGQRQAEPGWK